MGDVSVAVTRAFERIRSLPVIAAVALHRSVVLGSLLVLGTTFTVLASTNTPPTITSLSVSQAVVNEGQTVTLSATFTDPDATDWHRIHIDWKDGPPNAHLEKILLPPGQMSFQVTHKYKDDLPPNTIWVVVGDKQFPTPPNDNSGEKTADVKSVPIQVKNVSPKLRTPLLVTKSKEKPTTVSVKGGFSDPGLDTHTVTAHWGDVKPPTPKNATPCSMTKGGEFTCEHIYASGPAGTYTITVKAKDDDGGEDTAQTVVQIP